ncbi:MAG TPA: hypothetical protein VGI73_02710 [Solirubrobacterales bacterium]
MGGTADLEGLPVEVFGPERQDLAEAQAGVGEGADEGLVAAGGLGEAVHFPEAEDANRTWFLFGSRIVGSDTDALEWIEVADFVGDRVVGHRRESAEDADGAGGGSTFSPQHVINQGEGVAPAELAEGPVLQGDALDLHLGDAADAVLVGGVGSFGAGMPVGPGGEVVAEGVRSIGKAVCLVDRSLGFALAGEGAFAAVPSWLGDVVFAVTASVPGDPDDRARRIAALDRRLPPHAASSRCLVRKSSTSTGSIRRAAPSL